jgi:hypothetical protein
MRLLVSWIGNTDLRAPRAENKADVGQVAQAIEARKFDRILRLTPIDLLKETATFRGALFAQPALATWHKNSPPALPRIRAGLNYLYQAKSRAPGRLATTQSGWSW